MVDTSDLTSTALRAWILRTTKWKSILVSALLTAPGAATVDVEYLYWDEDASKFYRLDGSTAITLTGSKIVEIQTYQLPGIIRIDALAGNPTVVEIRVAPGVSAGMD